MERTSVPGTYSVVKEGKMLTTEFETNYIIDSQGNLILKTSDNILFADENGYLILKNGEYEFCEYHLITKLRKRKVIN